MENEKKPRTDGWDDFAGEFLKTNLVKEFPVNLIPTKIESKFDDKNGRARLFINTEYNGRSWTIELNKTNRDILVDAGIRSPKDVIGKILTFNTYKVNNPSTGKLVDSFIIEKVK